MDCGRQHTLFQEGEEGSGATGEGLKRNQVGKWPPSPAFPQPWGGKFMKALSREINELKSRI